MTALICFAVAKGLVLRTGSQATGSRTVAQRVIRARKRPPFSGEKVAGRKRCFLRNMPIASGPAGPGGPGYAADLSTPWVQTGRADLHLRHRLFCTTSEVDVLFVRPTVLLASAGSGWRARCPVPAIPASVGLRTDSARHRCTIPVAEPWCAHGNDPQPASVRPRHVRPLPGSCLWGNASA